MKVKFKEENCMIMEFLWIHNKKTKHPIIGAQLVKRGSSKFIAADITLVKI